MIVILDMGITWNNVLVREIRDLGAYGEIHPHDMTPEEWNALSNVKGIILNGGKNRIVEGVAVEVDPAIYEWGYPVIAVDYPTAKWVQYSELPNTETLKTLLFDTCQAEAN